ncbi:MAG: IPTL-CTERM sorting domain-containing protein, partial [Usitatibacter sp.]
FAAASVGGTCGGTLVGNTFTTSAITGACTVVAAFAPAGPAVAAQVPTMSEWMLALMALLILALGASAGASTIPRPRRNP